MHGSLQYSRGVKISEVEVRVRVQNISICLFVCFSSFTEISHLLLVVPNSAAALLL